MAHRLIWYAEQQGRQDAVIESLFRGYFVEGADIGIPSTLVQLADRSGLSVEAVERFLQSGEGAEEVKAEEAAGHRLGIRGVPYFVLNQISGISGAQPVDVFVPAIEKVLIQMSEAAEGSTRR
jgi:predicted DsbA family dithiol-disulfide isomerase